MRTVTLLTTGGTIEKTYNEAAGVLENSRSVVQKMLRRLRLEDTSITIVQLLSKDSLHITEQERAMVVDEAAARARRAQPVDGLVILHGTDTLPQTGEAIHARVMTRTPPATAVPIVLTGAMRPFELTRSDAVQNLTEALLATRIMPPGVYFAGHGMVLAFPGVKKDRARGTFVRA